MLAPLKSLLRPGPRPHVARRFRLLDAAAESALRDCLAEHYFADAQAGYLDTPEGRHDLDNHVRGRLRHDRTVVIPWLDDVRRLDGCRILEIGCGTGCSTVALAEQGAHVVGVDVSAAGLQVAEARCRAHDVAAEFLLANVTEVGERLAGRAFDWVIFYASLEHMTYAERIAGIRATWPLVGAGGLWCIIETPNRLWCEDGHTSLLPFYHWLPDELAYDYARFSSRPGFNTRYRDASHEQLHRFRREGRGVSYHELELALERRASEFRVVSSLYTHYKYLNRLRALRWPRPREVQFAELLQQLAPQIHRGFFLPQLDLVLAR